MKHKININYLDGELGEITEYLLLNTSFCDNIGILNGKMGVCLNFFILSKFSQLSFFQGFANDLLDEVTDSINLDTPIDFSNGLSGIAWGIDILLNQGFLDGDANDVLADYDRQIIKVLCSKELKDYSFDTGIEGILYYLLYRYISPRKFLSFLFCDDFINNDNVVNYPNLLSFIEKIDGIACIDLALKQSLKIKISEFLTKKESINLVDPIYENITKAQTYNFSLREKITSLGLVSNRCVSRSVYLLFYQNYQF